MVIEPLEYIAKDPSDSLTNISIKYLPALTPFKLKNMLPLLEDLDKKSRGPTFPLLEIFATNALISFLYHPDLL